MTVTKQVFPVAGATDWDLIIRVCHYSYRITNLSHVQRSQLYRLVYAESDGYGEKGFIPTQGYDWSGVRDSTPKAQSAMAWAARKYLQDHGVTHLVCMQQVF